MIFGGDIRHEVFYLIVLSLTQKLAYIEREAGQFAKFSSQLFQRSKILRSYIHRRTASHRVSTDKHYHMNCYRYSSVQFVFWLVTALKRFATFALTIAICRQLPVSHAYINNGLA